MEKSKTKKITKAFSSSLISSSKTSRIFKKTEKRKQIIESFKRFKIPKCALDDGKVISTETPIKRVPQIEPEKLTDFEREFSDGYDENLIGGEEDKGWLMQLTERERELELYNRFERRECLKRRFEIWKKLRRK
ncbi:RNA polymerase-associated protein RTF1 [Nephila pilipes]|uniref:RNA polymerase-associated protein RTF1 n=1 Tax=Nephila pilipes TaxID=299642 RepID=A0A8X6TRN3_NEPPI|nr:RNA polymerase-associated protein RTF1 [Nephila pilipes]